MASEITVALISGGVGLATGAIGSLFAPWANWGVEKARLRRNSRASRVVEWRTGVANLRMAEREDGVVQQVAKPFYEQTFSGPTQYDTFIPDPDLADVLTKGWFRTLMREVPKSTEKVIKKLAEQEIFERDESLPELLDGAIDRIESDRWKLV